MKTRQILVGLLLSLMMTGCVSFHAIEQERVDQGRLLTNGQNDPSAPTKIRKIVGIDIDLPHSGRSADASLPVEKKPEHEYSVLPMKGLKQDETGKAYTS